VSSAIASLELAPITRTTVADEIVKRLVDLILEGRLKPGDKLPSERELMDRLAVGRSSLREAIKTLRAVGVVDVATGEGMFVGRGDTSVLTQPLSWGLLLSERSAQEVIEARTVVEGKLAALAAERATDDELAAIAGWLDALRANVHDAEHYSRCDLEFHVAIARAAHNRVLAQVLESLRQILRVWIVEVLVDMDRAESVANHVAIYAPIRARDPEGARRVMEEEMMRAGARLLAVMARAQTGQPNQAGPDGQTSRAGRA
jgi:GntR family transcriptional repressor for pyruvate dehydrogenase complex